MEDAVHRTLTNLQSGHLWMANNGKVDASTSGDMETQVLLAHLPFVFRPRAEQVLVIGLGSGITAGSVTLHGFPKGIDIVELEPAVVAASHLFDDYNHRPLEDDRVRLVANDARNQLMLTPDGTYDLVTSEPSNPWISGVSNLFTREFFDLGKRKLRPGGVWAQWLHLYGMGPEDLRSLLATFAATYRHVQLFHVHLGDLVLIGSDAPLVLRTSAINEMVRDNPRVSENLVSIRLQRAEEIVARYLLNRDDILCFAGGAALNTDDNMRIEYAAPLNIYARTRAANVELLGRHARLPLWALSGEAGKRRLARIYERRGDGRARLLEANDRMSEAE